MKGRFVPMVARVLYDLKQPPGTWLVIMGVGFWWNLSFACFPSLPSTRVPLALLQQYKGLHLMHLMHVPVSRAPS